MSVVEELQSTVLYSHLRKQSEEYARRITKFVESIAPILVTVRTHFPYYTRHDAHHGFRVTNRIGQVLRPGCFDLGNELSLGHVELFLLIAAAYAHDLGMTVFPGEADSLKADFGLGNDRWETDEKLTAHLRENHSNRGGRYIHEHADELGVPENLVSALDVMMRSHNLTLPEVEQKLREPVAAAERVIDLRQLAAILCIGDAIEFSDTRVLEGVLELVRLDGSEAAKVSYRENKKHDCIRDSLALDDFGQIVVNGTFAEPDVLALAHRTFDQMEEWIRGYCDIDRQSRFPRLRIRPEPFRRGLDLFGARFERLGVRMSKRSVIDLIASNAVWRDDPGIALRELIQNAVEACRYRAHHSSLADAYRPFVRVVFDRANRTVSVHDNGCGMSESTILNNLLTVGNSRSKEHAYTQGDYAPIARFGIGFWSVFTIAERATIETAELDVNRSLPTNKSGEGIEFDVELSELKDYTVFRGKRTPVGTQVVLHLKESVVLDDVFERIHGHLLSAEVELTLVLDDEETRIGTQVPDVTDEVLLGARARAMREAGLQIFRWRKEHDGIDLAMALAYRISGGHLTFRVNENQSVISSLGAPHGVRSAVCGFIVPTARSRTAFALERIGGAHINARSPRGFDFSLDRRILADNAALRQFVTGMADLMHDGYRDFLNFGKAYTPREIYRLGAESEMNGGNVYDTYTGSELEQAHDRWADLLCFKLIPMDVENSEDNAKYVNLEQLQDISGHCWFIQNRIDISLANGMFNYLHPEQAHPLTSQLLSGPMSHLLPPGPNFILEANRQASMLFDADPQSTIFMVDANIPRLGKGVSVCVQRVNLANICFDVMLHGILAEVRGRWSGAVYVRDFDRMDGKPYAFLGRYRVVVKRSSRLHEHLHELKVAGRLARIATLVHDLTEDDAGFTPKSVYALL
jgi:hypothetical protein